MDINETDAQIRYLLGDRAHRVPAWMYVQNAGDGVVSFAGASRVPTLLHPMRYGSERSHQLIVGELVIRPHVIVATDALRGEGLGGLISKGGHDLPRMLSDGEVLLDVTGQLGL